MAGLTGFIRNVRRVVGLQKAGDLPDAQLLKDFVTERDEVAFEALVRRHGPMVLGVCRRVLQEEHDAEDAFQATFLVLLRKAHAIAKPELLGNWLFGVAYRIALRARAAAAKQRRLERQAGDMYFARTSHEPVGSNLSPMLEDEVNRLPKKYRAPVVLCYFEGKTNEEASRELGWPLGTVAGRLARAREMLRNRLTRRGMAYSAGVFVTALSQSAAPASVPTPLLASTIKAAMSIAAGHAAVGAFAASVVALAEGALHSMFVTKLKIAALVLVAASLVGAGGLLTHQALAGRENQANIQEASKVTGADTRKSKDDTDQEKLQGTWKIVSHELDGKEAPAEEGKEVKLTFRGTKVTFIVGENKFEATYKLNSTAKPKRIDLSYLGGPAEGKTKQGIYDLEGNTLRICGNNTPGGEVPSEFVTKAESGEELLVLKRADEEKEPDSGKKDSDKKSDSAAARIRSSNNLKRIGLAMHNFHDTYGRFPAHAIYSKEGKPLLSWRVAILPFIGENDLYKQFKLDESWDSENNKKLLDRMPKIYAPLGGETKDKHSTFYQVFVGKGTIFDPSEKKVTIASIQDGTSNTLFAAEAGEAVPWTKPDDMVFDPDKPLPALGGMFKGGFNVLMADGSVHFLKEKFDEKKMKLLIIRNDGQLVDVNDLRK
jgi:RNA polymerase sigma-70 factor (ECF subfamily)